VTKSLKIVADSDCSIETEKAFLNSLEIFYLFGFLS
jgi:hypothetical protein